MFNIKNETTALEYLDLIIKRMPVVTTKETEHIFLDLETDGLIRIHRLYPTVQATVLPRTYELIRHLRTLENDL